MVTATTGCCSDELSDLQDLLSKMDQAAQEMLAIYTEASYAEGTLQAGQLVEQIVAVTAPLDAVAAAPDPEASALLLPDLSAAADALDGAIDAVEACCERLPTSP